MNEPNTEPQPPPPEPPKARHPLAWLVFLLPSVLALLAVLGAATRSQALSLMVFGLSLGSCIYLGNVMESRLFRDSYRGWRVVLWAFCIIVLNAFLSICLLIGGCYVIASRL